MIIAAEDAFNNGDRIREARPQLMQELEDVIAAVDASRCKSSFNPRAREGRDRPTLTL